MTYLVQWDRETGVPHCTSYTLYTLLVPPNPLPLTAMPRAYMMRAGSRRTSDGAMRAGSSTPERVGGALVADVVTGPLTPPLDPRPAGDW
jgi:hypothetical protein